MKSAVPSWDHGSPQDLGGAPDLRWAFDLLRSRCEASKSYHILLDRIPTRQEFFLGLPDGTPRFCLAQRWAMGVSWQSDWNRVAELPQSSGSLWHSLRFDLEGKSSEEWDSFGRGRSWLPQIELVGPHLYYHSPSSSHDLLNAILELTSEKDVSESCNEKAMPATSPGSLPLEPTSSPRREDFLSLLASVLPSLRQTSFRKVVPAIRQHLVLQSDLNPLCLLDALAEKNGRGSSFLLDWGASCFLGHSPEQLYEREGQMIRTMALAGTRPRGSNPTEDQVFAEDLLSHPKDQEEHALVRDWLLERLQPMSDSIDCPSNPEIFALNTLQHLLSPVRAELHNEVEEPDLLEALFPTPAVLGQPSAAARTWLRANESFDRGLFAGLIGVSSRTQATWTVCIRSLLLSKRNAWLYAGAGVVADSDPVEEWDEIQRKLLAPLRAMFDVCHAQELQ
jgi:menaquinone-specific isochorismate synthase